MANLDQRTEALTILMEECAEPIQSTSKVLRCGPDAQSANGANSISERQTQEILISLRPSESHKSMAQSAALTSNRSRIR